jgi:hypothetical protein
MRMRHANATCECDHGSRSEQARSGIHLVAAVATPAGNTPAVAPANYLAAWLIWSEMDFRRDARQVWPGHKWSVMHICVNHGTNCQRVITFFLNPIHGLNGKHLQGRRIAQKPVSKAAGATPFLCSPSGKRGKSYSKICCGKSPSNCFPFNATTTASFVSSNSTFENFTSGAVT